MLGLGEDIADTQDADASGDTTSDGTLWGNIKTHIANAEEWGLNLVKSAGNVVLHPVDTVADAGKTLVKPVTGWFSSTLTQVIILLAVVGVLWFMLKKEIGGSNV